MPNHNSATNNRKQLTKKIDYLQKVTIALLNEVKSLSTLKSVEIEKGIDLDEVVLNFEIQLIERALEKTKGNQRRAARLLNVKYSTFCAKVKRYNIQPEKWEEGLNTPKETVQAKYQKGAINKQIINLSPI